MSGVDKDRLAIGDCAPQAGIATETGRRLPALPRFADTARWRIERWTAAFHELLLVLRARFLGQ